MPKFLRTDWWRKPSLGKKVKKNQKWRRAGGRHNKIREHRRGQPCQPSIGYRTDLEQRGKVLGKTPLIICNVKDLEKLTKENIAVLSKVGMKKKIEIAKVANEKKIEIANLKVKKFLKSLESKK